MFNTNEQKNIIALPMTQKEVVDLVAKGTRKGMAQATGRGILACLLISGVGYGAYKFLEKKQDQNYKYEVEDEDEEVTPSKE